MTTASTAAHVNPAPTRIITTGALIKRINRKLAHEGEVLRRARGGRSWQQVGDHYIVDVSRNFLVAGHVDPEDYGRELGVLKPFERVEG